MFSIVAPDSEINVTACYKVLIKTVAEVADNENSFNETLLVNSEGCN